MLGLSTDYYRLTVTIHTLLNVGVVLSWNTLKQTVVNVSHNW